MRIYQIGMGKTISRATHISTWRSFSDEEGLAFDSTDLKKGDQ
jgi:hypothetical protein